MILKWSQNKPDSSCFACCVSEERQSPLLEYVHEIRRSLPYELLHIQILRRKKNSLEVLRGLLGLHSCDPAAISTTSGFSTAHIIFPHCICLFLLRTLVSVLVQVRPSSPHLLGGCTPLPLKAEEPPCVCHKLSLLPSAAACGSSWMRSPVRAHCLVIR